MGTQRAASLLMDRTRSGSAGALRPAGHPPPGIVLIALLMLTFWGASSQPPQGSWGAPYGRTLNSTYSPDMYEPQPRYTGDPGYGLRPARGGGPEGFPRTDTDTDPSSNQGSRDSFRPEDVARLGGFGGGPLEERPLQTEPSTEPTTFPIMPPTPPPRPSPSTPAPWGKYPCAWRDRCLHARSNEVPLGSRNCYCDDLCWVYRDCCQDKLQNEIKPRGRKPLSSSHFTCYLDTVFSPNPFYLVDRCPKRMRRKEVGKKCRDEKDLWAFSPVSGKTSKILYKNEHCAKCHRETEYEAWNLKIDCFNLQPTLNVTSLVLRNTTMFVTSSIPGVCMKTYVTANENTYPRLCKKIRIQGDSYDIMSSCPQDSHKKTKRKCVKNPTSYRYHANVPNRAFRNEHCARCWGVNTSMLQCHSAFHESEGPTKPGGPLSLATLFNFSTGELTILEKGRKVVVRVGSCPLDQVYHPRKELCVQRYTQSGEKASRHPGYTTKKPGKPGASGGDNTGNTNTTSSDNNIDLNKQQCAYVTLDKTEYQEFANGSIYVEHLNQLIPRQDIVRSAGGQPLVCSDYKREYNVTVIMFQYDRLQNLVSFVGLVTSVGGLLILFVTYLVFRSLRNVPGKCLICHVFCLFCAQLLLLVGVQRTEHATVCFSLAIAMHYMWLAAFFWMNVMAFDIWRTFATLTVASRHKGTNFFLYSLYAWFVPGLIVGAAVAMEYPIVPVEEIYRPHYGQGICWITQKYPLLFMFALPMAVVLATNIVFFIMTVYNICAINLNPQMSQKDTECHQCHFVLYIKLSLIMGLTWTFAFLASLTNNHALWWVFIILNAFIGVFLCIAFLGTKRIYRLCRDGGKTESIYEPPVTPSVYGHRGTPGYTGETLLSYENNATKVGSHETSI